MLHIYRKYFSFIDISAAYQGYIYFPVILGVFFVQKTCFFGEKSYIIFGSISLKHWRNLKFGELQPRELQNRYLYVKNMLRRKISSKSVNRVIFSCKISVFYNSIRFDFDFPTRCDFDLLPIPADSMQFRFDFDFPIRCDISLLNWPANYVLIGKLCAKSELILSWFWEV